jgi:hypothetical protein
VQPAIEYIEEQIRQYAQDFLRSEYGEQAIEKIAPIRICAVDAYDTGGVSEASETDVKVAVKRDVNAGKLTPTTKLILRHELGHILENSMSYGEFDEEIEHEKQAWDKAKPKNAAEKWYRNISIRTHLDPLKMKAIGFPTPETKLSPQQLRMGTVLEVERMKKGSVWVDELLAMRYAMANLVENPHYYDSTP